MTRLGFVGAATLAILTSTSVTAQSAGIPAEFPPASFTGNQFVDSEGCAFIRAGRGGVVNWVPRVNRRRDQLCNFQPTFAGSTEAAAPAPAPRVAPLDAPVIEITAPAPQARNPLTRLRNAPIATVASIPAAVSPATPQVTVPDAPTPIVITAPAPVPSPVVIPEPEPRITLAEACEGRFGVQPGFISSRTGDPIDCGPAPQVAAATPTPAPVIAPAPAPAAPEQRRITLAEACAEMGTTNFRYISAQTGEPIVCPSTTMMLAGTTTNAAPTAPSAPSTPPAAVVPTTPEVLAGATCLSGGLAISCGSQNAVARVQAPAPAPTPAATPRRSSSASYFLQKRPAPVSNPVVTQRETIRPPSGYARVWGDGRLNGHRGLPAGSVAKAPAVVQQQDRVSTRTAPQAATGPSHRYIQVGSFGDHANADRLIQRLGAAGLPVGAGASGAMKIVAVGPFRSQADLQRAMQTVRGMGFNDAYLRN